MKIYDIFHIFQLKLNKMKNKQIEEMTCHLEFEDNKGNKYQVKVICNSAVYVIELKNSQLFSLYYLIIWKNF